MIIPSFQTFPLDGEPAVGKPQVGEAAVTRPAPDCGSGQTGAVAFGLADSLASPGFEGMSPAQQGVLPADDRPANAVSGDSDELRWLAFCYVADELTPAEKSAFEARLEHDLAACEALAAVYGLTADVQASFAGVVVSSAAAISAPAAVLPARQPSTEVLSKTRSSAGAAAPRAALAASVLALAGLMSLAAMNRGPAALSGARRPAGARSAVSPAVLVAMWNDRGTADSQLDPDPDGPAEGEDLVVPQWLLTAVSSSPANSRTDGSEPAPDELGVPLGPMELPPLRSLQPEEQEN